MSFQNIQTTYKRVADRVDGEVIELLVALSIIVAFLIPALDYKGPIGQFPRVFLIAALVLLGLELTIRFLPEPYGPLLQQFTNGLTDEMTEEMKKEVSEKQESTVGGPGDEESTLGSLDNVGGRLAIFFAVLIGFYVVAYLVGFFFAIPLFVFGIIYFFGTWNPLVWVGLSAGLMTGVYFLFGQIMNVPVMEGVLL